MYPRPLCENPKFIFNRASVVWIILKCGYYINGKWIALQPGQRQLWIDDFPYSRFNKMLGSSVSWEWLEQAYVSDDDGDPVYLFSAVPCGHCLLCNKKRSDDFATRCQMESVTSYTAPIMVTLTYNDDYLPIETKIVRKVGPTIGHPEPREVCEWVPTRLRGLETSDDDLEFESRVALRKKDVQKFLDRLRHTWIYRHKYPCGFGDVHDSDEERCYQYRREYPFRYVLVGEYGSKHGRPHYHLIMWNVPYHIKSAYDFIAVEQLKSDIIECWKMCDYVEDNGFYSSIQTQCEVARDAGKYVGKYLGKGNKNGRKGFFTASSRHGGIGARFIDSRIDYLRQNPQVNSLGWTDSQGRYVEYTLGRYATRRVYPSQSAMLPDICKQFYRDFCNKASLLGRKLRLLGVNKRYMYDFESECSRCSPDPVHLPSMETDLYKDRFLAFGERIFFMSSQKIEKVIMDTLHEVDILFDWAHEKLEKLPSVDFRRVEWLTKLRKKHFSFLTRKPVQDDTVKAMAVKAGVEYEMALVRETF